MNKTCEDCIHQKVCILYEEFDYKEPINVNDCRFFKDKSKLIELPCVVGDIIWCIPKSVARPIPFEVMGGPTIPIYHSLVDTFVNISDFGKIAFLTQEEAEKKLEELNGQI